MAILSLIILWVALLIGALCGLWMMVLGFKRHWAWGTALLLPQVAQVLSVMAFLKGGAPPELLFVSLSLIGAVLYLCFLVVGWPETKPPFFWWLTSVFLLVLFFVGLFQSGEPMTPQVARLLRARGVSQVKFERFGKTRLLMPPRDGTAPAQPSSRSGTRGQAAGPTPPPVFHSRLPPPRVAPGQREPSEPGIYYLLERVTTKSSKGVQVGLPGERVILLDRLPGNKRRVTVGNADFIVDASQLTDDVNVARELEKQDFVARGGQL